MRGTIIRVLGPVQYEVEVGEGTPRRCHADHLLAIKGKPTAIDTSASEPGNSGASSNILTCGRESLNNEQKYPDHEESDQEQSGDLELEEPLETPVPILDSPEPQTPIVAESGGEAEQTSATPPRRYPQRNRVP